MDVGAGVGGIGVSVDGIGDGDADGASVGAAVGLAEVVLVGRTARFCAGIGVPEGDEAVQAAMSRLNPSRQAIQGLGMVLAMSLLRGDE